MDSSTNVRHKVDLKEEIPVSRNLLAKGGFGVTEVLTFGDGFQCVLKTINKEVTYPEMLHIFGEEVKTLESLQHDRIPRLLGHGDLDGQPYILQEYIPGLNLEQIFKRDGKFSLAETRRMVHDIAEILEYIHGLGLAHRDVKPQNILRSGDGSYYLVDFGSSKLLSEEQFQKTGTIIGSFAYAAPEQVHGKACARSDIFSLGKTAVHLLTGLNERELIDPVTDEWLWIEFFDEEHGDRDFKALLEQMLQRATGKRPSAKDVMERTIGRMEITGISKSELTLYKKETAIVERSNSSALGGTASIVAAIGTSVVIAGFEKSSVVHIAPGYSISGNVAHYGLYSCFVFFLALGITLLKEQD